MIAVEWLTTAVNLWVRDGFVLPIVFAESTTSVMAAQPMTAKAMEADPASRVAMLSAMASSVGAERIGMVAEVWERQFETNDLPDQYEHGDLAVMAETDPLVHTAIIVTSLDLLTGQPQIERACHSLTDEGEHAWERSTHADIYGGMVDILRAASYGEPREDDEQAAHDLAVYIDWTVTRWEKA